MGTDIFKFWSGVRLKSGMHPADVDVLTRVKHGFELHALPGAFGGPLRTAPVVLLYLSPGLGKKERSRAKSKKVQAYYRRMWRGREPLPGPDDDEETWRWWKSKTKHFGDWQDLRTKVAILNIGAYHSKTFADIPLLAALPSSRVSLDWTQSVLFPEAMAGRRVVVCLRSARFWGLKEGKRHGQSLFVPPVIRSGHMKESRMRNAVIRAVRSKLAE